MSELESICEEMKYILDRNASDEEFLKSVFAYALSMEKALAEKRRSA